MDRHRENAHNSEKYLSGNQCDFQSNTKDNIKEHIEVKHKPGADINKLKDEYRKMKDEMQIVKVKMQRIEEESALKVKLLNI